jgi:hypothetical protein
LDPHVAVDKSHVGVVGGAAGEREKCVKPVVRRIDIVVGDAAPIIYSKRRDVSKAVATSKLLLPAMEGAGKICVGRPSRSHREKSTISRLVRSGNEKGMERGNSL